MPRVLGIEFVSRSQYGESSWDVNITIDEGGETVQKTLSQEKFEELQSYLRSVLGIVID